MSEKPIMTEFIRLGQYLKFEGIVQSGAEAKHLIMSGKISVNKVIEKRRGRKLFSGDVVEFGQREMTVK